jgi:hypothetical protein
MDFVLQAMSVCIIIQKCGSGNVRISIEVFASWVCIELIVHDKAVGTHLPSFLGPDCPRKHIRRILCPLYVAGFCPDGPECKFGQ